MNTTIENIIQDSGFEKNTIGLYFLLIEDLDLLFSEFINYLLTAYSWKLHFISLEEYEECILIDECTKYVKKFLSDKIEPEFLQDMDREIAEINQLEI